MKRKMCAVMGLLLLVAGCGDGKDKTVSPQAEVDFGKGKAVSQAEFGESWPLTVPNGRLSCIFYTGRRQIVTFIAPNGTQYALNGHAKGSGHFQPIDSIHSPDATNLPAKKNIGVLIDEGLKLCPPE